MKMQEMAGVRSLSSSFEMQCYSVICNKWKCDLLLHEKSHADPKDNWDPLEAEWMTGLLCRPLFVCVQQCLYICHLSFLLFRVLFLRFFGFEWFERIWTCYHFKWFTSEALDLQFKFELLVFSRSLFVFLLAFVSGLSLRKERLSIQSY